MARTSQGGIFQPDFGADVESQINNRTLIDLALLTSGLANVAAGGAAGDQTLGAVLESDKRTLGLNFTGVLTGNRNVLWPTTENSRLVVAKNSTTGAFTLTVKTAAGTGVAIASGSVVLLWNDGTNVVSLSAASNPSLTRVQVSHSVNQSAAHNTNTILAFDTEREDPSGFHDNVTNNSRLTIPSGMGGTYFIYASCWWDANATGVRSLALKVNGTLYVDSDKKNAVATAGYVTELRLGRAHVLAAGDYVQIEAIQTSGGALNIIAGAAGSYIPSFGMFKIG